MNASSAYFPWLGVYCTGCRSRRQLYEAVLAVERQGGTVLERPLALVDVVLSPSAGLVICDNSTSKLVGRELWMLGVR
jgi:hypothetical protein